MPTMKLPAQLDLGDITVRDGLQTLEHYVPVDVKLRLAEDLVLAGFRHIEVTNFGNPTFLPQFKDCEELLDRLFDSPRVGGRLRQNGGDVTVTAVTINERAVDRALEYRARRGRGPDCLLQMVSTDAHHHKVNSGMTLDEYWVMTERCTAKARQAGTDMCGTVSTIWGSPIRGHRQTTLDTAVEFSKRYLELGATYIEQADHDGSADPLRVFEYFSMVLDPARMGKWADPRYHLAHFHTGRGMGLANYLAALQAGVVRFETTMSATGGQPSNVMDGVPTGGTGAYYHASHLANGIVSTEDFVVMAEAMGIRTGIDVAKLLAVGLVFKEEVLRISPDARRTLVANVARVTGVGEARILALRASEDGLEQLIDAGAAYYASATDKPVDKVRVVIDNLLRGTRDYLESGWWCHSRAETLINGVPPSPHLLDLLPESRPRH
jgi:hydroxymethylglutaryl-CoA lyase